jgi:putative MATE family efflux protein
MKKTEEAPAAENSAKASGGTRNDFTQGSMSGVILKLAVPMTVAQLVNVLYNVVDRIYIGLLPNDATLSLTGLGVCLPIVSLIMGFANLFGMGGSPLSSIARGRGDNDEAEKIMANSFVMLLITGVILTAVLLLLKRPMLFLLGASENTFPYANRYLTIYVLGTVFVMLGLGMNAFIDSQGFARTGMMTVIIGAVLNLLLDPLFIFAFHMGVSGAALATVLSQLVSAVWILLFLTGTKTILRLRRQNMHLEAHRCRRIIALGLSGFVMSATNSIVEMVCNTTLQSWGGDLYVGVMTVLSSLHEIALQAVRGLTHSAQPVFGFNFGAGEYGRVKRGILFLTFATVVYALIVWFLMVTFPEFFIRIFNRDEELIEKAIPALHIYFFGFFMMALQFTGQSAAVGLGRSAQAVFFSIFRKIIIVVPLTILLPRIGFGVMGVFIAEPISNFIGGAANYITMLLTIWRDLTAKQRVKEKLSAPAG